MFKTSMVRKLESEVFELQRKNLELKGKVELLEKGMELEKEKAVEALRKEIAKDLIKSDLERTEAIAKLDVYEKLDPKEDRKVIVEMVSKLVDSIGKSKELQIVK